MQKATAQSPTYYLLEHPHTLCPQCFVLSLRQRPFPIAEKWAALVLEEFALQGDEEKARRGPSASARIWDA